MDLDRLDHLARSLASAGSRRRLLGVLSFTPVLSGLLGILDPEESDAKERRRRRKQRHKRRKSPGNRKRHKPKPCKPESVAETCAGRCGSVTNNCKQAVDCGSCSCDPTCDVCFTCQEGPNTPVTCVVDPAQQGETCGSPGQVCQADGTCACDAGSCSNPTPVCSGGTCAVCAGDTACVDAGQGDLCCADGCHTGTCCSDAACTTPGAPDCVGHQCTCDGGAACKNPTPVCTSGTCVACSAHADCGADALCVDGECHACDVIDGQNLKTVVGAAQDEEILYVCAGTYAGNFSISTTITLIGAGEELSGTIIQGGDPVLRVQAGTESQPVTLRGLRIQDGQRGILIDGGWHLRMSDCTVSGNAESSSGVGIVNGSGTLKMTRCTVENNRTFGGAHSGGGLFNFEGSVTLTDCLFEGNEAYDGGAIFTQGSGASVTLYGTRVTGNTATHAGSGIFNAGNTGSTVTLLDGSSVCANNPTATQCVNVTETDGSCETTCPGS